MLARASGTLLQSPGKIDSRKKQILNNLDTCEGQLAKDRHTRFHFFHNEGCIVAALVQVNVPSSVTGLACMYYVSSFDLLQSIFTCVRHSEASYAPQRPGQGEVNTRAN